MSFAASSASSCNEGDDFVSSIDHDKLYFKIDMGLALASSVSIGFVSFLIFSDKRL